MNGKLSVEIDRDSGFCFGVLSAIGKAQEELQRGNELYCLGDIVHNGMECNRLQSMGLKTINHNQFDSLQNARVLLRAHGEPPSTYQTAARNGITLIDATCPVVLKLQQRILSQYRSMDPDTQQIIIFGQKGHAEVLGLVGQTGGNATVIESADEIDRIDFSKDIFLYSQTTKSAAKYNSLIEEIDRRVPAGRRFVHNNTVCGQVSHRREHIRDFAGRHDVILFVSGSKSSNGKVLFGECLDVNPHSYMIEDKNDIDLSIFGTDDCHVGICGATSTPKWLMEDCKEYILTHINANQL